METNNGGGAKAHNPELVTQGHYFSNHHPAVTDTPPSHYQPHPKTPPPPQHQHHPTVTILSPPQFSSDLNNTVSIQEDSYRIHNQHQNRHSNNQVNTSILQNSSNSQFGETESVIEVNNEDSIKNGDKGVVKSESSPEKSICISSVSIINNSKSSGDNINNSHYNITSFEEAAVSLSFALRVVKTCEELMGKSEEELINGKLCGKLRVASENLSEASMVLENYISTHANEFGQLEEVKFDIKNFMKADQEHGDNEKLVKDAEGDGDEEADFKKYDMKVEAAGSGDEQDQDEEVEEEDDDNMDTWDQDHEDYEPDAIDDKESVPKVLKPKKNRYKCSECSYTAKKSSNLKTHVEAKHQNNMYTCGECDFTTTTHAYLKVHKHKHTVISEKRHFCDQCNLSFNRNSRLQHHISVIHEGKRLNCNECDYTCKYHSNLKEHVNRIHRGIVYKCDICDYQTGSDKNLKVHTAASHETGEFHCEKCEYTAQSKTRLQYHVNRVHKGKIFIRKKVTFFCDQCSASFSSQKLLDIHIEVKHGTQMFNCSECKYTTKSEFYLHRHIKKHSAQVLYCDQCDYSTQVKELFKVHQNKHTGVTFKCSFCQFESHSKFNLGQHVKKVHEKSSVGCPKCSFVATAQVYLRRHIKKVHPEGTDQQHNHQNNSSRANSHHLVQPQPQQQQQHHNSTTSVKSELTASNQW